MYRWIWIHFGDSMGLSVKNIAHRMQSIFSFRRIGMRQGKKSGSHHFPLHEQPNCRGDVIFPAGRGWRPSIGFAMQNYDKFCNIPRQKCVILFHTIQLSHARGPHAKTRRYSFSTPMGLGFILRPHFLRHNRSYRLWSLPIDIPVSDGSTPRSYSRRMRWKC